MDCQERYHTHSSKVMLWMCCWLITHLLPAQEPAFRHFTPEDGLPSSEVYQVIQDHLGYMWFATDAGISRYDGYSFKTFTTADGLCDNTIFELKEDRHNRIWCRTSSGCFSYIEGDKINNIEANTRIQQLNPSGVSTNFFFDENDAIYLGFGNTLYKILPPYTKENLEIIFVRKHMNNIIYLYYSPLGFISNSTTLQFPDSIRFVFENQNKRKREYTLPNSLFYNCFLFPFDSTENDYIFICKNTIYTLSPNQLIQTGKVNDEIVAISKTGTDAYWIAYRNNGVSKINTINAAVFDTTVILKNYRITGIKEDHEGGTWFTTLNDGVFYLPPNAIYKYADSKFSNNRIHTLAATQDGVFAINSTYQLYHLFQPDQAPKQLAFNYSESEINLKMIPNANRITFLDRSCFELNTSDKSIRPLPWLNPEHYTPNAGTLERDSTYRLFLSGRPVFIAPKSSYKEWPVFFVKITSLTTGKADTTWVGTYKGLYYWTNDTLAPWPDTNPLLHQRIEQLFVFPDGTFAICTRGNGVLFYNRKSVKSVTIKDGLTTNLCRSLSYTGQGHRIWVGTTNGVHLLDFDARQPVLRVVNTHDGLTAGDITSLCLFGTNLYAATMNGIVRIDTTLSFKNAVAPPILFTHLLVLDQRLDTLQLTTLNHRQNTLEFHFHGVSYVDAGLVTYKYKLEGADNDWNYTTNRFVRYTILPPGNYRFIVFAVNSNGICSEFPIVLSFTIAPPFWATWWFITACTLVIGILLLLIIRNRIQKTRRAAQQAAEFRQQIAETELKALRAQMNPHFIFNAVNSIQNYILKNEPLLANRYLTRFAKLIRHVLELSRNELIPLQQELDVLKLYMEMEQLRLKHGFSFDISLASGLSSDRIIIPPLLLQPYVENAIWHGLQHKQTSGSILIEITLKTANELLISITDDGVGREESNRRKTRDYHSKSFGLGITRQRLDSLGQLLGKVPEVIIIDLTDLHNNSMGTQIEISIPLLTLG